MSLNSCRERIRMGPFSTRSRTVSVRAIVARDSPVPRHSSLAIFLSSTTYRMFLSCSLPRSAAIVFGPDVMHADAEIPLSPRSTEDRLLCLLQSASMTTLRSDNALLSLQRRSLALLAPICFDEAAVRQHSPLDPLKIARSAYSDLLWWRHCGQTTLSPRSTEEFSFCTLFFDQYASHVPPIQSVRTWEHACAIWNWMQQHQEPIKFQEFYLSFMYLSMIHLGSWTRPSPLGTL